MTVSNPARPVIFGEVLFDCFPDGTKVLGGAPFNVAWNLHALGMNPLFISRVGNDAHGEEIVQTVKESGMDDSGIQIDERYPTGTVEVTLKAGEPSYEIINDTAYDHIQAEEIPMIDGVGIVYHGSLALRNESTQQALKKLLNTNSKAPVFLDVNLRRPWYKMKTIVELILNASWCKLNQDEFNKVKCLLENHSTNKSTIEFKQDGLTSIFLTKGKDGASVLDHSGEGNHVKPSKAIDVVDMIGAGDGFSSVLIVGLLLQWDTRTMVQRAQEFASAVVGIKGAVSQERDFYNRFSEAWQIKSAHFT